MRLLIDTNIFIYREDFDVVDKQLQDLSLTLSQLKTHTLIHPLSIGEIKKDKNIPRREIMISKIGAYPILEEPPIFTDDENFKNICGIPRDAHDHVDFSLLYCVLRNAVDFLITEDLEILKKAQKLGISERVFSISDALDYFKVQRVDEDIPKPPALQLIPAHNLNTTDQIFRSLRKEYHEFDTWWFKISREGRKAWVYFQDKNQIGALLIYKIENEAIPSNPPLKAEKRIKICTFKVTHTGHKIGELFIKLTVQFAIKNDVKQIYLTHYTKESDELSGLLNEFGFRISAKRDGEDIYLKEIIPQLRGLGPVEISKIYYPSFYHGQGVNKFIVPIRPEYHVRLFADYVPERRQPLFPEMEPLIAEGNTIKKAYLCHSSTKKIVSGDIVYFYRSHDYRAITSLGVLESVFYDLTNEEEIIRRIGKRSVYTQNQIHEIARKPTTILIFTLQFHLKHLVTLNELIKCGIMKAAPQSISQIDHLKSEEIIRKGGVDERFVINQA